jgi:hypothetical protein
MQLQRSSVFIFIFIFIIAPLPAFSPARKK